MNYIKIDRTDMNNGSGLRVVLWLSGCSHKCNKCQNPQTWDINSGILFDESAESELFEALSMNYISGITFSGGDPLHENNISEVLRLCDKIRLCYGNKKSIWLYTGFYWEEIFEPSFTEQSEYWIEQYLRNCEIRKQIVSMCDVMVDGRYVDDLKDQSYPYAGSTNQSVIDVQKSLQENKTILWKLGI